MIIGYNTQNLLANDTETYIKQIKNCLNIYFSPREKKKKRSD